jgi:hypothetical protein
MSRGHDVAKIKVSKDTVGIVGLERALADVDRRGLSSDEEISDHLLETLRLSNFIPAESESEYAMAFLREYKRSRGMPIESEESDELVVQILGPGCPNCEELERTVYRVMRDSGIVGRVEHIRDLVEIAAFGILPTPALVINGTVKSTGRLPPERRVLQWLEEAAKG